MLSLCWYNTVECEVDVITLGDADLRATTTSHHFYIIFSCIMHALSCSTAQKSLCNSFIFIKLNNYNYMSACIAYLCYY